MGCTVLVAYATRFGSTAGVADVIGEELREAGMDVVVADVDDAPPVDGFDAAVIGSAIYSARWMREAAEYIERNTEALNRIPSAYFQVCLSVLSDSETKQRITEGWLEPANELAPPVSAATFPGALDRSKLSGGQKLMVWMAGIEDGDYRDWEATRSWTRQLIPAFTEQAACRQR